MLTAPSLSFGPRSILNPTSPTEQAPAVEIPWSIQCLIEKVMTLNTNDDTLQARYAKIPVLSTAEIDKLEDFAKGQINAFIAIPSEIRRLCRIYPRFLPEVSYTSYALAVEIHKIGHDTVCTYHAPSWTSNKVPLTARSSNTTMTCGCSTEEVLLEFFLTKTQRTLTRDPILQQAMFEAREKGLGLDPWTRKMICGAYEAETFLKIEDIYAVKYGKPGFQKRLNALQLKRAKEYVKYSMAEMGAS